MYFGVSVTDIGFIPVHADMYTCLPHRHIHKVNRSKFNTMGKSIRSKQKRKWRRIKRDKIYKPLAEERLMASLSTLNTAVLFRTEAQAPLES